MKVQYNKSYIYKVDSKDHALMISALQYVSKHEREGDFGNAVRKLLNSAICSDEIK